jgi:hypothetical protein
LIADIGHDPEQLVSWGTAYDVPAFSLEASVAALASSDFVPPSPGESGDEELLQAASTGTKQAKHKRRIDSVLHAVTEV